MNAKKRLARRLAYADGLTLGERLAYQHAAAAALADGKVRYLAEHRASAREEALLDVQHHTGWGWAQPQNPLYTLGAIVSLDRTLESLYAKTHP